MCVSSFRSGLFRRLFFPYRPSDIAVEPNRLLELPCPKRSVTTAAILQIPNVGLARIIDSHAPANENHGITYACPCRSSKASTLIDRRRAFTPQRSRKLPYRDAPIRAFSTKPHGKTSRNSRRGCTEEQNPRPGRPLRRACITCPSTDTYSSDHAAGIVPNRQISAWYRQPHSSKQTQPDI